MSKKARLESAAPGITETFDFWVTKDLCNSTIVANTNVARTWQPNRDIAQSSIQILHR